jgi:hypothetical protein
MRAHRSCAWLAVALTAAAILASCGAGPTNTTTSAVAPASLAAPAIETEATTPPPTRRPALTPTPTPVRTTAPMSSASAPAQLPAGLVGTWAGNPSKSSDAERVGSVVPLTYTVTLKACATGDRCGQLRLEGKDAAGASVGCSWTLRYTPEQYVDAGPGVPSDAGQAVPYLVFREEQNSTLGPGTKVSCDGAKCKDYLRLRSGDPVLEYMVNCAGTWQELAVLTPAP